MKSLNNAASQITPHPRMLVTESAGLLPFRRVFVVSQARWSLLYQVGHEIRGVKQTLPQFVTALQPSGGGRRLGLRLRLRRGWRFLPDLHRSVHLLQLPLPVVLAA